ncbi:MAG: polysaccharide biosynthesis C-terminal domain-containing protein, partial [Candidatus Saccharibacteria bacterium]|nr:polysaccharide biosynthesis C-terminal domain-containing protein [Candidatus Saccharibacteria bacterium]
ARLLLLGVSLVLVTVYLLIAQPFAPLIGVILVIILIPESLSSLAESYWLQQQRPARVGLKTPIFFLIVGFAWLASNFTTSLMYLSIFWLVASVVTAVWFFPWQSIAWSNISLFQRRTIKSIRGAATYAVIATAGLVYSRADQLIIQWFRGFGALGIYSAAYRLIDSINLLPQAIAENLFPEAAKPGTITLKHLYKIEAVIGVIGAVVAMVLFVLAEWAVVTLLGTEYLAAIPLIHVFCVLLWLFFINAPLASVIQSSSLVRTFLPFGIANTVLNVLLNLLLVPSFGLVAAAWSMVLTEAIGLLINVYFVRRLYRS